MPYTGFLTSAGSGGDDLSQDAKSEKSFFPVRCFLGVNEPEHDTSVACDEGFGEIGSTSRKYDVHM